VPLSWRSIRKSPPRPAVAPAQDRLKTLPNGLSDLAKYFTGY
jgi:hypothetical protein